MNGILQQIIDQKRVDIAQDKQALPLDLIQEQVAQCTYQPRSMKGALRQSTTGIIAEFKRKSPSKGWISQSAHPVEIVQGYEHAGASAASILTDTHFFGGSIEHLKAVRPLVALPLLRKEFIIDPYQLYQAKVIGADAILLIAACLSPEACYQLAQEAQSLGLEVLLEIHTEAELSHLNPHIDLLGVNNRNLDTFQTDINTSLRLAERMQKQSLQLESPPLLVSESGISNPETVRQLRAFGFEGFLMGETFMKNANPAAALAQFIAALQ